MIDWLASHGGIVVLLTFFGLFVGFSVWAYLPANKEKMNTYGQIPLEEKKNVEQ